MRELADKLCGAEPLDLASLLREHDSDLAELLPLREIPAGDRPLLDYVQRVLDALQQDPLAPLDETVPTTCRPWWTAEPSTRLAALFLHVGLCSLRPAGPLRPASLPSHARESAKMARTVLRRLGIPFAARQHALALILNCRKAESLVGGSARAETYMRLACHVDLRSLYRLARAELAATAGERAAIRRKRLEASRARAEGFGVFGRVPAAPLSEEEIARLGHVSPRELHRAANALRYFRLRAGLADEAWCADRLRQESTWPRGRLNLLVGPAGCGKSSWARERLGSASLVSSDGMRAELTGDPADQSQNYLVFQRCVDRIRSLLKAGEAVTFDATNFVESLRQSPVQAARWCGAEIHSYLFDVELEAALERNRGRGRRVPEHIIHRHFRLLTPPALYEADQHWVVDGEGEARLYWPVQPAQARSD